MNIKSTISKLTGGLVSAPYLEIAAWLIAVVNAMNDNASLAAIAVAAAIGIRATRVPKAVAEAKPHDQAQ